MASSIRPCDTNTMYNTYHPPVAKDDDFDGYSPDDGMDCDDNDNTVYVGALVDCNNPSSGDHDCDGVADTVECMSPVIVDVLGDGFHLTDARRGVMFDLDGDGIAEAL